MREKDDLIKELFCLISSQDYPVVLLGYRSGLDNQVRKARCQAIRKELDDEGVYDAVVLCAKITRPLFNLATQRVFNMNVSSED